MAAEKDRFPIRMTARLLGVSASGYYARVCTGRAPSCAPGRPDLIKRDFECPIPTCRLVGDIRRRPHSTVGYRIPAELVDEFFERTARCNEEVTTLVA